MKAPINWLKEFVDIKLNISQLSDKLLMTGTEVEASGADFIDIKILPNRGDCQCIVGLAQEIAAITGKPFKKAKKLALKESAVPVKSKISVTVKDFDLCPRYGARVIENVKVAPSPAWLQEKLIGAGLRPINNIVDVTNYVMLEMGQPMHAFDLNRLAKNQIIVRRAAKGEKMLLLDGTKIELKPEYLVIADGEKPVALAGIMGGANSEVTEATGQVLLEAAFFTPNKLHRTSRELRLRTDSSIRFEKGLDWGRLIDALDKAANLIAQLGGGTICKGRIDIKKKERKPEKIKLSLELVNGVLGTTLKAAQVAKILKNLGFGVVGSSTSLTVTIPFSRGYDVYRPIDLVEEVARVYGYEKIPASLPNTIFETKFDESREKLRLVARQVLAGKGLTETMSYSLIDPKELEKINLPVESILRMPIKLANPLAQEQSVMRTSLLPSLMSVLSHNINRQVKDVRIFECSKIYFGKAPDQITEKEMLAGVLAGNLVSGKITNKGKADLTFSHLKGIVEDLIEALGLGKAEIMPLPHYLLHPGIAAVIRVGGVEIGNFGRLNPAIENNYDLKLPVFAFEIDLEKVFGLKPPAKRYRPLPKFPQVERDLAILVEGSVNNATIVDKILKTGVPLVKEVILFDQYLGENLGGKKSLAYRIIYQDPQRTLTDEIVAAKHLEISNALAEQLGASLR